MLQSLLNVQSLTPANGHVLVVGDIWIDQSPFGNADAVQPPDADADARAESCSSSGADAQADRQNAAPDAVEVQHAVREEHLCWHGT